MQPARHLLSHPMGNDDVVNGSFRIGADRLPGWQQEGAFGPRLLSILSVAGQSLRHAGLGAGDH